MALWKIPLLAAVLLLVRVEAGAECSFQLSGDGCEHAVLHGEGDASCCKLAEKVFGQTSGKPSCFCEEEALTEPSTLPAFFNSCNSNFGARIGYLGGGEAFCHPSGAAPKSTVSAAGPSQRSLVQWVKDLRQEPILLWTSILAVPGTLGTVGFLWAGLSSVL